jgi:hypothetical protein
MSILLATSPFVEVAQQDKQTVDSIDKYMLDTIASLNGL